MLTACTWLQLASTAGMREKQQAYLKDEQDNTANGTGSAPEN